MIRRAVLPAVAVAVAGASFTCPSTGLVPAALQGYGSLANGDSVAITDSGVYLPSTSVVGGFRVACVNTVAGPDATGVYTLSFVDSGTRAVLACAKAQLTGGNTLVVDAQLGDGCSLAGGNVVTVDSYTVMSQPDPPACASPTPQLMPPAVGGQSTLPPNGLGFRVTADSFEKVWNVAAYVEVACASQPWTNPTADSSIFQVVYGRDGSSQFSCSWMQPLTDGLYFTEPDDSCPTSMEFALPIPGFVYNQQPSPTPTGTPTSTSTGTSSSTSTPSLTTGSSPSNTDTPMSTGTATATGSATGTSTGTRTPTRTRDPQASPSSSITPSSSPTKSVASGAEGVAPGVAAALAAVALSALAAARW